MEGQLLFLIRWSFDASRVDLELDKSSIIPLRKDSTGWSVCLWLKTGIHRIKMIVDGGRIVVHDTASISSSSHDGPSNNVVELIEPEGSLRLRLKRTTFLPSLF